MPKKSIRTTLSVMVLALSLLAGGCWDRREIEYHGFVLGTAIDYAQSNQTPKASKVSGPPKYRMTLEMPKLSKSSGDSAPSEAAHVLFAGEGESMFEISRSIGTKAYFAPFFEDVQVIIFSEDVARDGLGDIFDFFLRDPEMRRRTKLFVSKGRADDILKAKVKVPELTSVYISKMSRNVDKTPTFASKMELGELSKSVRTGKAFTIPMISLSDDDIVISKSAVFNHNKIMVGELSEHEVVGAKLLRDNLKQGVTVIENPDRPDTVVVFELFEPDIKVDSIIQDDGRILFSVKAHLAGNLGENTAANQNSLDPQFLEKLEQAFAEEFVANTNSAFKKLQGYKADVSHLGDVVRRQHPDYWRKIKENWEDEYFPNAALDIDIKIMIRRTAMTK